MQRFAFSNESADIVPSLGSAETFENARKRSKAFKNARNRSKTVKNAQNVRKRSQRQKNFAAAAVSALYILALYLGTVDR